MGRSQVKYRTTHGRGRGRGSGSASGGRGGGGGTSTRGQGGRRPLESNAFRYDEERDDNNDDNEQRDGNEAQDARTYSFRRQFFAGEENVREAGATPSGAYFQSQTMKQWDADDEDDTDVASGKSAVGVLDFHWLGEQLALVAPSVRYQMDPKYCVDFAFKPQEAPEEDSDNAKEALTDTTALEPPVAVSSTATAVLRPTPSSAVSQPTSATTQNMSADSELDLLLELSSSALPSVVAPTPLASVSASSTTAAVTHQQQQQQQQQSDEDWLDDVLDM